MDTQVLKAQQWVNRTYGTVKGYIASPESGSTGWSTMYSLTRALQHELKIAVLSDYFGEGTMAALTSLGPISRSSTNINIRTIVEAGLYCKGYSGGSINGAFTASTQSGIAGMKNDLGLPSSGDNNTVNAKELRTLLTMDAYKLLPGGSSKVRDVQRWMNGTYVSRKDYKLIPCDGYFSRDVQRGLMLAIQYSIGMPDGTANGNFGPGTRDGIRAKAQLSVGSVDSGGTSFVKLFKAALIFNKVEGVDWPSSTYTTTTADLTRKFQLFCRLTQSGGADYQTWCSLLVSTGDPERTGTAADCMTPLNDARAKAIKAAGYSTVGRYITGGSQKILTDSEISIILKNGLSFFPIYQEYNNALSYFDKAQGRAQAEKAHASASKLGLPTGSIIYFAVDYDAVEEEIRSNLIPFFEGVFSGFTALGSKYSVGIYGSRNICSVISATGYAVSSFVSGMSTGFSGNLGFPLPLNWAFDQVQTLTLNAGLAGEIEIDKNIKSNRDPGISSLTKPIDQNAAMITWLVWLEARALEWWNRGNHDRTQPHLVAQYLRNYFDERYTSEEFTLISGPMDRAFIDYCDASAGRPDPATLRDPKTGLLNEIQHFGASACSMFYHSLHDGPSEVSLADFGGWAGDLITAAAAGYVEGVSDANAYTYAYGMIGNSADQGVFSGGDLVADIDAMVLSLGVINGKFVKLSDAVKFHYASADAGRAKYSSFVSERFKDRQSFLKASQGVFTQTSDVPYSGARATLWAMKVKGGDPVGIAVGLFPKFFSAVSSAFVDVVYDKYIA